jgi:hypothetical protein
MSKGSPIVNLRIPSDRLSLLDAEIDKVNRTRRDAPYTRSSFILAAIDDKLKHLKRSRGKRRPKTWPPVITIADAEKKNLDNPSDGRLA